MNSSTPDDRYYQLFLIRVRDPEKWGRYLQLAAPIVAPYEGRVDRQLVPESLHGDGLDRPDFVNLASSPSRERHEAFGRDERFLAVVGLRTESTSLASVSGASRRGAIREGDVSTRRYLVEIARFGPEGEQTFRRYEEEAEAVMSSYGYHVERELLPDTSNGLPFQPDVVKLAYFDDPAGMERLHGDPAHARLEAEYSRVTSASIWVVGRDRPL